VIRKVARKCVGVTLEPFGYTVVRKTFLDDYHAQRRARPSFNAVELPAGAREYLQPNHPRLRQLESEYAAFDSRVTTPSIWTEGHLPPESLRYFRGDNAFVWQHQDGNDEIAYCLTAYYLMRTDPLRLMERLDEDGAFGNYTCEVDGKLVSRCLLDSITEIGFLERHLRISQVPGLSVLDIGAGYGRLATG
jgi:hypothetical protein